MSTLILRAQQRAYANTGTVATPEYNLIGEGFTDLSQSKNAKEYSRQYIHESSERSDVVGYSPSLAYSFDMHSGDPVCEKLAEIADEEKRGEDAHIEIVLVHLWDKNASGKCRAFKRTYSAIPDSDGSGTDALIYTGTLKAVGEVIKGYFDETTKTFTADGGELGTLFIELVAGEDSTHTKVSDVVGEGSGTLKYKVGANITKPAYGTADTGYSALTLDTAISCAATNKIVVVEVSGGVIVAASAVTKVVVGS